MELNQLFEWMKEHKPQPVHIKFAPEIIRFTGLNPESPFPKDLPTADELRNEGFYFGHFKPITMESIKKVHEQLKEKMPLYIRTVCVWTEEDRIFYAMNGFKVFDLREAENGTITVTEWKNPPLSFSAGEPFPSFPMPAPPSIQ